MTKFEEKFPSLENHEFIVDGKKTNYKYVGNGERVRLYRDKEISQYCQDNARVKDVIEQIMTISHTIEISNEIKKRKEQLLACLQLNRRNKK